MDMCRKYINGLRRTREEEEVQELTTEIVRENGVENYEEDELLGLCKEKRSERIIMRMMIFLHMSALNCLKRSI